MFIGGKVTMQYIAQAKKCSVAFCSVCRRMCGWKVTVICLCIGYNMADLWCIISADELSSHVAPRLKYSSVCNSSSEVNWSGGMLWCLNGRVCCFLLGGG